MRTRTKHQSKPAAVRHVVALAVSKQRKQVLRSEEENDDEEGRRGPQIIVLPRITLNKHLGFRRDPLLSLLPCLEGDKDFGAKNKKIKIKIKPSNSKTPIVNRIGRQQFSFRITRIWKNNYQIYFTIFFRGYRSTCEILLV
jgi:hypothetical protein